MKFLLEDEPNSGLKREGVVIAVAASLTFNSNLLAENGKIAATTQAANLEVRGANPDAPKPENMTDTQATIFEAEAKARKLIAEALIELKGVYESVAIATK